MEMIIEESAKLNIVIDTPSKKLPVFYNKEMKLNRDITILLLNAIQKHNMQIALPLAGSGIRAIRMIKELNGQKIKHISINDLHTPDHITKQLKLNKINTEKITITKEEASSFLLGSKGFDFIDIDPFGSPNPFLDASMKRLSRDGILAVTATDTSALAGSHPVACKRKYDAIPMKNYLMHEIGIRILIRKIQLVGAQYAKALVPIFSYWDQHYYRIFFRCTKGKKAVDSLVEKHQWFHLDEKTMHKVVSDNNHLKNHTSAGPLWTGYLWDHQLVNKMRQHCSTENKKLHTLIETIYSESMLQKPSAKENTVLYDSKTDQDQRKNEKALTCFIDLQLLAKARNKHMPKTVDVLNDHVMKTHFSGQGVRCIDIKDISW